MDPEALVREAYTRMAMVYEARVAPRFLPIAQRTVALARLRPGEAVVDIGCGTGLAALLAAEAVGSHGEAVGVDFSEGQLGVAAGKAALRGMAAARWERADATALPWAGRFDAALSNLGLPARADLAFASIHGALKPAGRLSVATWEEGRNPGFDAFRALVEAHQTAEPDAEVAAARAASASRKALRQRWGGAGELRAGLEAAGFREVVVRAEPYDVSFAGWRDYYDFMLSWGWTEQEVRAMPAPDREALQRGAAARFGAGPFTDRWRLLHTTATRRG